MVTEPQGSHQIVSFKDADGKIIKIIAPSSPKVHPGDTIHVAFKYDTMRFFDPDTTMALDAPASS